MHKGVRVCLTGAKGSVELYIKLTSSTVYVRQRLNIILHRLASNPAKEISCDSLTTGSPRQPQHPYHRWVDPRARRNDGHHYTCTALSN